MQTLGRSSLPCILGVMLGWPTVGSASDPAEWLHQVLFTHGITADPSATSVLLLWKNKDDLDLSLKCGASEVAMRTSREACGAEIKLDANIEPDVAVENPVEYIIFKKGSVAAGHYEVIVDNYRQNQAEEPCPYTAILQRKTRYDVIAGTISPKEKQTVIEFDVP